MGCGFTLVKEDRSKLSKQVFNKFRNIKEAKGNKSQNKKNVKLEEIQINLNYENADKHEDIINLTNKDSMSFLIKSRNTDKELTSEGNTTDIKSSGGNGNSLNPFKLLKANLNKIVSVKKKSNSLSNVKIDSINYSAMKISKFYKNQLPPNLSSKEKFIDSLFLPNLDSILGRLDNKPIDKVQVRYKKSLSKMLVSSKDIIWLRPCDIFPNAKYTLFEGEIEINDVIQGNLGNCYFLSAIAAMCEFPQMIVALFRTLKANENGYYEIIMNLNGEWNVVIIDDFIPCNKITKKPLFCKSNNSEIWVLLLEKAWAKVNGGYVNIIGGWPCDVLEAITPFCVKDYSNKEYLKSNNLDELWNTIYESDLRGNIMTCTSNLEESSVNNGLVSKHAFTIISAHISKIRNNTIRLLRIRNPWGFQEWNGAWSDGSKEWDEESIKAFGHFQNKDDGTFFMELSDYTNCFTQTQICIMKQNACTKSLIITKDRIYKGNIIQFTTSKYSEVDFSVIKRTYRFHRSISDNSELTINLLLMKLENNSYKIIYSEVANDKNPILLSKLEPGNYIVYILANQSSSTFDKDRKLVFNVVSNNFFEIKDRGVDDQHSLLKNVMKAYCQDEIVKESSFFALSKNKVFPMSTIGLFYIKNLSSNEKSFKLIKNIENYRLLELNTIEPQTELNLPLISSKDLITVKNIQKSYRNNQTLKSNDSFRALTMQNNNSVNIKLNSNEDYILIGDRNKYYSDYIFDVTVSEEGIGDAALTEINVEKSSFNYDILEECHEINSYDYIFKKYNIDLTSLTSKIDMKKLNETYFQTKYPEMMEIITKYEPLSSHETIFFMDITDIGYGIYFGEWVEYSSGELKKKGRGLTVYSDGSKHCGYYDNDDFNGKGEFLYKDGSKISIDFINGRMNGRGELVKNNITKECHYENGIVIKD